MPTYATPASAIGKGIAIGALIAIAFALLFAWIPEWNFYLSLLLAFGVAEAIARVAKNKRGADLQVVAIGVVVAAMALARVFLAYRAGFTWEQVNAFSPPVQDTLRMSIAPDGFFAVLTVLIPWYRFR